MIRLSAIIAAAALFALVACVDRGEQIEAEIQAHWTKWESQQKALYVGRRIETMYPEWGVPEGRAPVGDGWFYEFTQYTGQYRCVASALTDSALVVTELELSGQRGCARYVQ
jgi:hypothetical protein